jgi:hypothetical protein
LRNELPYWRQKKGLKSEEEFSGAMSFYQVPFCQPTMKNIFLGVAK